MELTDYVKEFRALQKTGKIRVADFCREKMLDYYEMVEALKKDKFLSELPAEEVNAAELDAYRKHAIEKLVLKQIDKIL